MRTRRSVSICAPLFVCLLIVVAADEPSAPALPKDTLPRPLDLTTIPLGLRELPSGIPENPITAERVALGRRLFFSPILSRDGTVSCASCHRPEHGMASPDALAIGIEGKRGARNAPSVLNRGYGTSFFWDGSATTLEEQVLIPIENVVEFDHRIEDVLTDLAADESWVAEFATAFSVEPARAVSRGHVSMALASFVRALRSGDSPVDRFQAGDYTAISDGARQGLWIFESRGGCWRCHSGALLTDEKFHNTGIAFAQDKPDEGRRKVTGRDEDRFAFKTQSLRGLTNTAPYMHDGSLETLEDVVRYYARGGNREAPGLSLLLEPLDLDEKEIGFLVEFLEALSTDPR